MENVEKVLGLQDFITNACNKDTTKKTKLSVLYNSYRDFTKEISMEPYSKKTFKAHIDHLFKIKKDPESNNLLVSGIKLKEEQQQSFKITPYEAGKASLEEAKADMFESNLKKTEENKNVEIIAEVTPISSDTKVYIDKLKKERQFIDKKISIMQKLDNLKNVSDTLFSTTISNIDKLKDSKEADEISSKINDAIKTISSIKI